MRSLGIRVEPKKLVFVVLDVKTHTILNIENIKVPQALSVPEQLKYLRSCVLDILREYEINVAGIRIAESNSQNLNVERLHIEGVIQESFASSDIDNYFTGRKSSISSRLQVTLKECADIISGDLTLETISNWGECTNANIREAAMVALGAAS